MDASVDHYEVLGLPSGEEGAKISEKDVTRAYRLKALELHPDKRPDDPHAKRNFQNLKTSYHILIDAYSRKSFDNALRAKRQRQDFSFDSKYEKDSKRQKLYDDLVKREREASRGYSQTTEEEERILEKLHKEIAEIRAKHAKKTAAEPAAFFNRNEIKQTESSPYDWTFKSDFSWDMDESKILKVSWNKSKDYTAVNLRELFSKFGVVEDVVFRTRSCKHKSSAIVVMWNTSAAQSAATNYFQFDDLEVKPLRQALLADFPYPKVRDLEYDIIKDLVSYNAYENFVFGKLQNKCAPNM